MTFLLTASQCPPPSIRSAFLSILAAVTPPGTATVAESVQPGSMVLLTPILRRNAARQDLAGSYGGGGYFVAQGLTLSAGTGLSVLIAAGTAMIDGPVNVETQTALGVPNGSANCFIFLLQNGALAYSATTAPPPGACCLLGNVTTAGGAVTAVDYSGVLYGLGILQRQTADAAMPTDTPPAGLHFVTLTNAGKSAWYWDGATYHSLDGQGSGQGAGSGLRYRQAYNPATAYVPGDITLSVSGDASGGAPGALYEAVAANTSAPVTSTAFWTLFLPPGAPGDPGQPGPAGEQGPAGSGVYNPRGPWNSAASYAINDAVYDATGAYVAILASSGIALTDAAHWSQILPPGPPGVQGPSAFNPRGQYSASASYAVNDIVQSSGAAYLAVAASTGQLVTNPNYWYLLLPAAPQGSPGAPGAPGPAGTNGTNGTNGTSGSATVTVGTTSTLSAGSMATVSNSGSSAAATLNFGIPQGAQGPQGTAGTNGTNGTNGTSPTLPPPGFEIYIPGALAAGLDTFNFLIPSFYSSRPLTRLSAALDTAGTSATMFTAELSTGGGAFTAAQTSDTFALASGSYLLAPVTAFTSGLTASAENRVKINITAAGTGAKDLTVKFEF